VRFAARARFSRLSILTSFLIEVIVLAAIGGVIGSAPVFVCRRSLASR
jgi:hypothetical protein